MRGFGGEITVLHSEYFFETFNQLVDSYGDRLLSFNHMVNSEMIESPELDRVFHALADGTRRSILRGIAGRERTVGEIAEPYRMSLAAVSKHLKVLERAELVVREKRGSFQFVRTNAGPMKQAQRWLSYYERFWNERLDEFGQHFKDKKKKEKKS